MMKILKKLKLKTFIDLDFFVDRWRAFFYSLRFKLYFQLLEGGILSLSSFKCLCETSFQGRKLIYPEQNLNWLDIIILKHLLPLWRNFQSLPEIRAPVYDFASKTFRHVGRFYGLVGKSQKRILLGQKISTIFWYWIFFNHKFVFFFKYIFWKLN